MWKLAAHKPSAALLLRLHVLLWTFLFCACRIDLVAAAEPDVPVLKSDLPLPAVVEPLSVSEDRLSLAMELARTEGLATLRRLVGMDESYAKRLGYDSLSQLVDEKKQLASLPPFPVFRVGLTQLQNYDGNIATLFTRNGAELRLVVPIALSGREQDLKLPLSAITVRLGADQKTAKVVKWGSKNLIKFLSTRRHELTMDKKLSKTPFFVMEVLALNRLYLGYKKPSENIMLMRISGVKPGDRVSEQSIDEVLKALVKESRIMDKTPR